ncbi:class I SAM-dependent methyltransferase [Bacteroidota bacterium]
MKNKKQKKTYFYEIRKDILPLIPPQSKSLLDVGCGGGYTAKYIKENFRMDIVEGVEISPEIIDTARSNVDKLYTLNLENVENFYEIFQRQYDCILLLDILEHMVNPYVVLSRIKTILSKNGVLIISLPNIRHYRAVAPLLFLNEWKYTSAGPLDRTHLRFFTLKSMRRIINEAGFEIISEQPKRSYTKSFTIVNLLSFGFLSKFSVLQYLFLCRYIKNND